VAIAACFNCVFPCNDGCSRSALDDIFADDYTRTHRRLVGTFRKSRSENRRNENSAALLDVTLPLTRD